MCRSAGVLSRCGGVGGRTDLDPGTKLTVTKIHRTLVDHDEPTTAKPRTVYTTTTIQAGVLPSWTCPPGSRISIFYFPFLHPSVSLLPVDRARPARQASTRVLSPHLALAEPPSHSAALRSPSTSIRPADLTTTALHLATTGEPIASRV